MRRRLVNGNLFFIEMQVADSASSGVCQAPPNLVRIDAILTALCGQGLVTVRGFCWTVTSCRRLHRLRGANAAQLELLEQRRRANKWALIYAYHPRSRF